MCARESSRRFESYSHDLEDDDRGASVPALHTEPVVGESGLSRLVPEAFDGAAMRFSCAGAVVGVSLFSRSVPEAFGAFDAAFMTLFYVTGGDPWPDSLQKNKEDGWRPPH